VLSNDFRCTFGTERCGEGTLKPTITDLCSCYTFNNDPNNQLSSHTSGWYSASSWILSRRFTDFSFVVSVCLSVCRFVFCAFLGYVSNDDAKACQKLLRFDVPTTLWMTILVYLHSFSCRCVRNMRNLEKFTENSNLCSSRSSIVIDWCQSKAHMQLPISHK